MLVVRLLRTVSSVLARANCLSGIIADIAVTPRLATTMCDQPYSSEDVQRAEQLDEKWEEQMLSKVDIGLDESRRRELADYLRSRRARLRPEEIGLVPRGRRRVAGLRRHELADHAGVSLSWYTWLEQGREIRTTAYVLDALARALRLDEDGRRHLRRLGGHPVAERQSDTSVDPEDWQALVDELSPWPAYVTTSFYRLLAWNEAFARTYVDPAGFPPERRDGVWMYFRCPQIRQRLVDWEREARIAVSRLHYGVARHVDSREFDKLVAEMREDDDQFAKWWSDQEVMDFKSRCQTIDHPTVGRITMKIVEFSAVDTPQIHFVIRRPINSESRAAIQRLIDDNLW